MSLSVEIKDGKVRQLTIVTVYSDGHTGEDIFAHLCLKIAGLDIPHLNLRAAERVVNELRKAEGNLPAIYLSDAYRFGFFEPEELEIPGVDLPEPVVAAYITLSGRVIYLRPETIVVRFDPPRPSEFFFRQILAYMFGPECAYDVAAYLLDRGHATIGYRVEHGFKLDYKAPIEPTEFWFPFTICKGGQP